MSLVDVDACAGGGSFVLSPSENDINTVLVDAEIVQTAVVHWCLELGPEVRVLHHRLNIHVLNELSADRREGQMHCTSLVFGRVSGTG